MIAIKNVRFAQFLDAMLGIHDEPVGQIRLRRRPAIQAVDHDMAIDPFERGVRVRHVHQRRSPIVGDVEIQIAVPVNVPQRQ